MNTFSRPQGLESLKQLMAVQQVTYDLLAYNLGVSPARLSRCINGFNEFTDAEKNKISKLFKVALPKIFPGKGND